jgi:hypothetical protein
MSRWRAHRRSGVRSRRAYIHSTSAMADSSWLSLSCRSPSLDKGTSTSGGTPRPSTIDPRHVYQPAAGKRSVKPWPAANDSCEPIFRGERPPFHRHSKVYSSPCSENKARHFGSWPLRRMPPLLEQPYTFFEHFSHHRFDWSSDIVTSTTRFEFIGQHLRLWASEA